MAPEKCDGHRVLSARTIVLWAVGLLFGKAADQLGSDKAPIRLADLHALERLAQSSPAHRQTIVNLICASAAPGTA